MELDQLSAWPIAMLLGVARMGPLFWVAPFSAGRLLPPLGRLGVALAFSIGLAPSLVPQVLPAMSNPDQLVGVVIKEVMIGAVLGFWLGMVFWAIEAAGRLIDVQRGGSQAEQTGPLGSRSSPLGAFSMLFAVAIFFAIGGHRLAIAAIFRSYETHPLLSFPSIEGVGAAAQYSIMLTGEMIASAVILATPVVASLFLADLALAWVNRFVPQFNAFFWAMPAKSVLAVVLFALGMSVIVGMFPELMSRGVLAAERALDALAGP